MKTLKNMIVVSLSVVSCSALASLHNEVASPDSTPVAAPVQMSSLGWNGIYSVPDDVEVEAETLVVNDKPQRLGSFEAVQLYAGEKVALEYQGEQVVMHFAPQIDAENKQITQKVVLNRSQVEKLGLKIEGRGGAKDLEATLLNEQTKVAGRMILRHQGRVIARGCLAYVLKNLGLRPAGGVGGASNMANYLIKKQGWRKGSCAKPVDGMVGSRRGKQHTAIWRKGRGWCYDQGCFDPGKGYHLFQCAVRR